MRVNRKVSIWKHVRLADGKWRYCRPVLDAKEKIVADLVLVNDQPKRHPEGTNFIDNEDAIVKCPCHRMIR